MGFTIRAVIEGLRDRLVLIIRRLERPSDLSAEKASCPHGNSVMSATNNYHGSEMWEVEVNNNFVCAPHSMLL